MLRKLESQIVECADDILKNANRHGVVPRTRTQKVVKAVRAGLGPDSRDLGGRTAAWLAEVEEHGYQRWVRNSQIS